MSSPRGSPGVLVHNQCFPLSDRYSADNYLDKLDRSHLEAVARESRGEVVARRPDGQPFDHIQEVADARQGIGNTIRDVNARLACPGTSVDERAALEVALSRASSIRDNVDNYLRNSGALNSVLEKTR
ncbi:hypothetical protein DV096_00810 [Bradymonadaceae bacterium TMQ3]|uniref:Bacterial toxin 28 domain-containing protein n=1 Tax=Lujinxingia sediminis TaxID=2480984 RepID=A0ABY0CYL9_9DELT|nr:hypothetical protein DV096_00810 [Bradymonadaceae bacterium TMQ3]RVU48809.1 hypothetical protein EA187_05115 [Lujinxingia sediminis]TXC78102.1 hypothetical protein FRC91_05080 [Bradymonadales bacterium TMQ1]